MQQFYKILVGLEKQTKSRGPIPSKIAKSQTDDRSQNWGQNIQHLDKDNNFCPPIFGPQSDEEEAVTLFSLLEALRLFCRSSDWEVDMTIFRVFNMSNQASLKADEPVIEWNDIQMMLLNLPILGFTMSQNHECIDDFNRQQRNMTVDSVVNYFARSKAADCSHKLDNQRQGIINTDSQ